MFPDNSKCYVWWIIGRNHNSLLRLMKVSLNPNNLLDNQ